MTDESLLVKVAGLELEHWDECIKVIISNLVNAMQSGIPIETVILYMYKGVPFIPLEEMPERGRIFHMNHARKVLELVEKHSGVT